MDKAQALYTFWASFGLLAYDEQTVPDGAAYPYITYETSTDSLDNALPLTASLWYRSPSWAGIEQMAQHISETIGRGGVTVPYDGGALWITRRAPFAQRMSEPSDDMVRRMYISITAEFLGAD